MRKILIIAIGVATLGALAGAQPAGAAQSCHADCSGTRRHHGQPICRQVCTTIKHSGVGSGATQNIQQKKNNRQF